MQALMLAAGMGRRLGKYTEAMTKCMISVGGRTLLERTVEALKEAGIRKFVMVVGWEADKLVAYIRENIHGMEFEFVYNYDYATTNNIYSLYLAREQLLRDDTLLLESDLVYDHGLLAKIVKAPERNLVTVAAYEPWMDGTVTTLDEAGLIAEFISKSDFKFENASDYYKTVNIYKFSKEFAEKHYLPFLEAYIKAYGTNQYYETVLKVIAHISNTQLKAYVLEDTPWYEIDDAQDLDIANTMFAMEQDKLAAYERHYGGYWRFPGIKDFCYLVNPYFPPEKMVEQMKYVYTPLLTQYPSGMEVQKLLAGRMFNVDTEHLLVGNGAAELINELGKQTTGRVILPTPSFNEYVRCFPNCEIIPVDSAANDYRTSCERLLSIAQSGDTIVLVNPDNPSGWFVEREELLGFLAACRDKSIRCVVDESFADFADSDKRFTLLSDEVLSEYPTLIVIKSISKSYGVQGLRLGVIASSDHKLLCTMRERMAIWNINSFAEYFLQIYTLYRAQCSVACDKIAENRHKLMASLREIPWLTPYPSQANYIMCRIAAPWTAKELATKLLTKHNILIKTLSEKRGFEGAEFIRIAVKDEIDNCALIRALKGEKQ